MSIVLDELRDSPRLAVATAVAWLEDIAAEEFDWIENDLIEADFRAFAAIRLLKRPDGGDRRVRAY